MQKLTKALAAIMLMTAVIYAAGCKPEHNDSDVRVTTYTPQDITQTSAVCGGDAIVTQGLSLSSLGVCWSTERNPTAEDAHLSTTNWSEPYICTITGLESGTKYHVRAYALRGLEYYYGDDKTFTTVENSGGNGGSGGGNGGGGEDPQTYTYTITTSSSPADGGTVTGGGTYNEGESVTLRANANTNYTFDRWQDGNTANPRTITVTSNASYTAYFTYNGGGGSGNGNANGHAYVDLGLPSGTLWATCNVGATTPEGYGNYYAWGETTTKTTYNWSTYRWCNGSSTTLTKYCNSSIYGNNGFTDNLTTLQLSDDAARANWGGDWRMPTKAEWEELKNNTTVTWTTQNGVYGRKFTASNGNSLFLPAAGFRGDGSLYNAGRRGYYWSSSLYTDYPYYPYYAWYFYFLSDNCSVDDYYRFYGHSVRAVLPASKN